MSGRFVIKWTYQDGPYPFLKVARRFCVEKKRTVPFLDWEASPASATNYGSAEAALSEWDRLGYARRSYVEVVPV